MSSPKGSSKNPAETAKHTECETPFGYIKFYNTILEILKAVPFSLCRHFILYASINETEVKLILQIILYYVN